VSARRGRAVEGQLRAAQADPSTAQPHPVSQDANPGTGPRGQPAAQAREVNRLHKALEDAGIKLDTVAADILGKSGRDMLDALVAGETDPTVLAELARRQMRKKIPALREALQGHVDAHHRLWIGAILRHIDFLDEQIEQLTGMIEEQIRPFAPAVELLCTMTGIQHRGAQCIIAEIGVDMSCFATARHLASSAGRCPGNDQSAGKRRSGKTRDGSKWLDFAPEEAAIAAIRLKGHYLEAQYRRLKPRRGHKRALGAVKHTMLCAIWHMLSTGETYRDLGGDYYTNRDPERQTRRLVKQLERLGHHVTLQEAAAA
jgi:transposase